MSSRVNNEFSRELGKGFGEHLSLKEVFEKSNSLKDLIILSNVLVDIIF